MPRVLLINRYNMLGVLVIFAVLAAIYAGTAFDSYLLTAIGLVGFFAMVVISFGFTPFLLGNTCVVHFVRGLPALPVSDDTQTFIVQLALSPRIQRGMRGWLEDADDIGVLHVSASEISFCGDYISLRIPTEGVVSVESHSVGPRGIWYSGRRIKVTPKDLVGYDSVEFLDRESIGVFECNRNSDRILKALTWSMEQGNSSEPNASEA